MLKVLIAEDNILISDLLEEYLLQQDYHVCGVAQTVNKAIELAKLHKPDLLLLDQRLSEDGLGTEISARLGSIAGMGVLYITGDVVHVMETAPNGHACLRKPYRLPDVLHSIKIVMEMVATGTTSLSFPRGFWILPSAVSVVSA